MRPRTRRPATREAGARGTRRRFFADALVPLAGEPSSASGTGRRFLADALLPSWFVVTLTLSALPFLRAAFSELFAWGTSFEEGGLCNVICLRASGSPKRF